jgi:hypothetical protein
MMKMNSISKITVMTGRDNDDDDEEDMYDKMYPDALTALSDPTTL